MPGTAAKKAGRDASPSQPSMSSPRLAGQAKILIPSVQEKIYLAITLSLFVALYCSIASKCAPPHSFGIARCAPSNTAGGGGDLRLLPALANTVSAHHESH